MSVYVKVLIRKEQAFVNYITRLGMASAFYRVTPWPHEKYVIFKRVM